MPSNKRKFKLLFKFLSSYLLILIISIIIGLLIYNKTIIMLRENVMEQNLTMLKQSRDIMDRHIQELDSVIERIALDPRIITISNIDKIEEGSKDIKLLITAVDTMEAYRLPNNFIEELYIYFQSSDNVIMATQGNSRMELIYGKYFSFNGLSYEDWRNQIVSKVHINSYLPASIMKLNGSDQFVVTKLQSIPMDYPKINRGCIMAFISTDEINKLFSSTIIDNKGSTYILNGDTIITSLHSDGLEIDPFDIEFDGNEGLLSTEIDGENIIISYVVSELNEWKYVTVVSSSYILSEVNYIRNIIIVAGLLVLVIGFLLSMFFSYKNSKPIKDLYDLLKESFGESSGFSNEYTYLKSSVYNLISNNSILKEKLNIQMPLSKTSFLRRLLYDSYMNIEEIETNLSFLNIDLSGSAFVVVITKVSGYRNLINHNIVKELALTRLVINHLIEEMFGERVAACEIDETRIVLVLQFDTIDKDEIKKKTEKTVQELYSRIRLDNQIYINFAAGGICFKLNDIGSSFIQAKQALGHITSEQEKRLVWYDNVNTHSGLFKYTAEMKIRLTNLIRSGDKKGLNEFLEKVRNENFGDKNLPLSMLRLLFYQMVGTLLEVSNLLNMDYPKIVYKDFSQTINMEYEFNELCKSFVKCCDFVVKIKNSTEDVLYRSLCDYIDEQYIDECLNLQKVASEFNLKETYLYHFFKEKTGLTFAGYIEKKRMSIACMLLKDTDFTIEEISSKIGYGSAHSFRRAFKRCNGYNPSEMRCPEI